MHPGRHSYGYSADTPSRRRDNGLCFAAAATATRHGAGRHVIEGAVRIRLSLTLDYDGAAHLRERLLAWGLRGRFRLAEDHPDRWVLRRGSRWGSFFVLGDVHALYAEVEALQVRRTQ